MIASHIYVAEAGDQRIIVMADSLDEAINKAKNYLHSRPLMVYYVYYLVPTEHEGIFEIF